MSGCSKRLLIKNASLWEWNTHSLIHDNGQQIDGQWSLDSSVSMDKNGIIDGITRSGEKYPSETEYERVIDAEGGTVIPGLIDSHIHISMVGESSNFVNLAACTSIDMMVDMVRAHCDKNEHLRCIVGVNWDQSLLGRYPTRQDIDLACTNKPVIPCLSILNCHCSMQR